MAQLKNLIVSGASRFLNKIYANDVSISDKLSVGGYSNVSYPLSTHGLISDTWIRTTGNTGWYNESYGGGWYMTDSNYIRNYNKPVMLSQNLYLGSNTTYYFNTSGSINANAITSTSLSTTNLTSTNGRFQDLQVDGEIRQTSWNIDNITNLGSSFYIAPCIIFNAPTVNVTSISGNTITLTIVDNGIQGSDIGGAIWTNGSSVKLMGRIGPCVLGVANGTLTAQMASTSKTANIQVTVRNLNGLTTGNYSGANVSDLKLMMYEVRKTVNSVAANRPIGILMTSYNSSRRPVIDIYNGDADDGNPVVRIGDLNGVPAVNNTSPTGYGFYAKGNAYLQGTIVSTSGTIGGFTIGDTTIYNGSLGTANSVWMSTGTSGSADIGGSGSVSGWAFTAGATYGVTKGGNLYASSGKIAGWTIDGNSMKCGTWGTNGGAILCTGTGSSKSIGGSENINGWVLAAGANFGVTNSGALYCSSANITGKVTATSGTIGGFTIAESCLYNGRSGMADTTNAGVYIGTNGIALGVNDAFTVTANGTLTATNATIKGNINATTGYIGGSDKGWTVTSGKMRVTVTDSDGTHDSGFQAYGTGNWAIAINASNVNDWSTAPFRVKHDGSMYSTKGQIGGFTITSDSIYSNNVRMLSASNGTGALTVGEFVNNGVQCAVNNYGVDIWTTKISGNSSEQSLIGYFGKQASGSPVIQLYNVSNLNNYIMLDPQTQGILISNISTGAMSQIFSNSISTTGTITSASVWAASTSAEVHTGVKYGTNRNLYLYANSSATGIYAHDNNGNGFQVASVDMTNKTSTFYGTATTSTQVIRTSSNNAYATTVPTNEYHSWGLLYGKDSNLIAYTRGYIVTSGSAPTHGAQLIARSGGGTDTSITVRWTYSNSTWNASWACPTTCDNGVTFKGDVTSTSNFYGVKTAIGTNCRPTVTSGQGSLGTSTYKWSVVYATNGAIQTSDRNQKENIFAIDDKQERLFNKLKPVSFSFKGVEHDRTHIGFISQDVEQAMNELGMTSLDFAGFCKDKVGETFDENGEPLTYKYDEDGNPEYEYSLRYSEFIALNTHMIQKLMKENEKLKERVKQLENILCN